MATQKENEDSALDSLVNSLEFENKNFIKMIEKENQLIEALSAQIQKINEESNHLAQRLPQLEENIYNFERQYASIQDNIDSQKKTRNLLFDHELALNKQLETVKLSTVEKCKFYQDQISNYDNMKNEYMKKYATLSLTAQLKTEESKLVEIDQKLNNILDMKAELKQQITEKEEYLDARVLNRIVIKIAKAKLETIQLNKEIAMIQAKKITSADMDSANLSEKLNSSQLCSHTDQEDAGDKMAVELGIDDYCADISSRDILTLESSDEFQLNPNKTMFASDQSAVVSSITEEEFHLPHLDPEATSSYVLSKEHCGNAQENQRAISDISNPLPNISTTPLPARKPLVQLPSFKLPSLPKLPVISLFSNHQSMNKVQQPDHQASSLQKDQQSSRDHQDIQIISQFPKPSTFSLKNEQMAENVNDAQSSTSSKFQTPRSSLLNEELARNCNEAKNTIPQFPFLQKNLGRNFKEMGSDGFQICSEISRQNEHLVRNFNTVKNTTSSQFQLLPPSLLQNEHLVKNINEAKNTTPLFQIPPNKLLQNEYLTRKFDEAKNSASQFQTPSDWSVQNKMSSRNLNDMKETASVVFPKTSTSLMHSGQPADNHDVNKTSTSSTSLIQNKQLARNLSESNVNTLKQFHLSSASVGINETSSKSIPEIKSSSAFHFKNPFNSLLQNEKSTSNFSEATKAPSCPFQMDMLSTSSQSFNEINSAAACQQSTLAEPNKISARNLEKPFTSEPFSMIQFQESCNQIHSETGDIQGFMNAQANGKQSERAPSMFHAKNTNLSNFSFFKEMSPVKASNNENAKARKSVFEDMEAQREVPSNNTEANEEDQPEFSFNFTSGKSSSTKGSTFNFGQFCDFDQDMEENDPTFLSMANSSPEKFHKVDWNNFMDDDDDDSPQGKDLF